MDESQVANVPLYFLSIGAMLIGVGFVGIPWENISGLKGVFLAMNAADTNDPLALTLWLLPVAAIGVLVSYRFNPKLFWAALLAVPGLLWSVAHFALGTLDIGFWAVLIGVVISLVGGWVLQNRANAAS